MSGVVRNMRTSLLDGPSSSRSEAYGPEPEAPMKTLGLFRRISRRAHSPIRSRSEEPVELGEGRRSLEAGEAPLLRERPGRRQEPGPRRAREPRAHAHAP